MKYLILSFFALNLMACSHGNCRSQKIAEEKKQSAEAAANGTAVSPALQTPGESTMVKPSVANRVRVFKPDGSLQCGQGLTITAAEMQKQLGKIQVFSSVTKNDGMMRIQVCGAPTGMNNVYEIARKDLSEALKKGFKEWTFE